VNQAEGQIGFIYAFISYPEGLCDEDWNVHRPLTAQACRQVTDEDFRVMGQGAIKFFDHYFLKNELS
jgi:hypothetical protein